MRKKHIYIVDDEPKITHILQDFLHADGFSTDVFHDGKDIVSHVLKNKPDLVILDLMLPSKDGLTICKEIRQESTIPIIMLTARIDEVDRLVGLNLEADDYICKPFSPREVSMRVKTILRRVQANPTTSKVLQYKYIEVDKARFQCKVQGELVNFTPIEFRLLAALLEHPGMVLSRDSLMNKCYQDTRIVSYRTIDSHMKNVRSKIKALSGDDMIVHSVYGVGYKVE